MTSPSRKLGPKLWKLIIRNLQLVKWLHFLNFFSIFCTNQSVYSSYSYLNSKYSHVKYCFGAFCINFFFSFSDWLVLIFFMGILKLPSFKNSKFWTSKKLLSPIFISFLLLLYLHLYLNVRTEAMGNLYLFPNCSEYRSVQDVQELCGVGSASGQPLSQLRVKVVSCVSCHMLSLGQ